MKIFDKPEYIARQHTPILMRGGKASGMTLSDVAKIHGMTAKQLEPQLKKGIKHEFEHTNSARVARRTALDHLVEFPDYYDRLDKIEKMADGGLILYHIYSGKEIKDYLEKASFEDTGFFDDIMDADKYELKEVKLNRLYEKDKSLSSFVDDEVENYRSNKYRWDFGSEYPIVIGDTNWEKNVVLDGYHRITQSIADGNDSILAFVKKHDNSYDDYTFKKGGSLSKTPAPPSERIRGSKVNKAGSAKSKTSGRAIKFSDKLLLSIKTKVKDHNRLHPNNKVHINTAKSVVRRGMGAYSVSHRPTISGGKPNSRQAWGLARLNAFLKKKSGQGAKSSYVQDDDLL